MLFNWEGTIQVLDYDYWRSTPLINKPWFINPGLTLSTDIFWSKDLACSATTSASSTFRTSRTRLRFLWRHRGAMRCAAISVGHDYQQYVWDGSPLNSDLVLILYGFWMILDLPLTLRCSNMFDGLVHLTLAQKTSCSLRKTTEARAASSGCRGESGDCRTPTSGLGIVGQRSRNSRGALVLDTILWWCSISVPGWWFFALPLWKMMEWVTIGTMMIMIQWHSQELYGKSCLSHVPKQKETEWAIYRCYKPWANLFKMVISPELLKKTGVP